MDNRVRRPLAAAVGLGCTLYALYALTAIPRTTDEFHYTAPPGGNAFWPLPFAPLNGFTPEQLSSHLIRTLLLAPGCALLGYALSGMARRKWPESRLPFSILASCALISLVALVVIRGTPLQDD